jgi:hypothetical protein
MMALGGREDIMVKLLKCSKNGSTKAKMKDSLSILDAQLKKI